MIARLGCRFGRLPWPPRNVRLKLPRSGLVQWRLCRARHKRHSFAVNALLRWYREGANVEAELPLLAPSLGHVCVIPTSYYLHWIEPLRTAASERFARHYGQLVVPVAGRKGGWR